MNGAHNVSGYARAQRQYDNARPPEGDVIDVEVVEDYHQWKAEIARDDSFYLTPDTTTPIFK